MAITKKDPGPGGLDNKSMVSKWNEINKKGDMVSED